MNRKKLERLSKYELIEYIKSLEEDIKILEKILMESKERKQDEHTTMGNL